MRKILLYTLLLGLAACTTSKKNTREPRETKAATAYPDATVKPVVVAIKSRYIVKDSSLARVFLEMEVENLSKVNALQQLKETFRMSWLLQSDYGVRDRLAYNRVDFTEQNVLLRDNKVEVSFEIQRPKNITRALLLTEIFEVLTSKKSNNDLVVDFSATRLSDRYGLFVNDYTRPIFRNYINKKDTFQIRSLDNHINELFLIRYTNEFDPAQSPMATSLRPPFRSLKIEEILKVKSGTPLHLENEGLYFAVEDTMNTRNGFGFLIVDNRYPRYTMPEKLVKPLIYMSTSQETRSVSENADSKQAMDRYFLGITGGNQALAKKIIRTYYRRIEEANQLFTSFKEGWKTDKGMVYIVLGPPNKVQRSRDREVWMYAQTQNFSEIIFTFNKKPNQFTDNYYELVRYPEYQAYWYPFVEAWRTGNVAE
ncbi:GWxTD domain-containing protein [Emticicia sp. 21SJ11W-3]|uniref:GWxTD domain-containing protein n=1 Tax=Emticicia sp. 21SJ11W-3 TaxID=2916755 RepID=UPI00209D9C27|nr:GWxTD domain-containing protein [Emticicia sp. 21SJ11W-3]UTA69884.1 GWxTD domain-containing protein [Emticicia sp. 21SJ11W-3]